MVVDLDLIKQCISMQGRETGDHLLPVAIGIREHLYSLIEYREIPEGIDVWIVAGLPRAIDREHLINRLCPTDVIFLDVTEAECVRRVMADTERPDKELQRAIIRKWFDEFQPVERKP